MDLKSSLHQRLTSPITDFAHLGETIQTPDGQLTHIDNGSNVLAVAHLDWVSYAPPCYTHDGIFRCPQLDDRLGAWIILDLLPHLGIVTDILLTDSEEVGRSTAQYFQTSKQYNWMFEVDRRGTDAVTYQYADAALEDRLIACGWEIGNGSFSDISYLEHLGCRGINFGAGYHREHTPHCYALWSDIKANVSKIVQFYREYADTPMPYADEEPLGWTFDDEEVICLCGCVVDTFLDDYCPGCGMDLDILIQEFY